MKLQARSRRSRATSPGTAEVTVFNNTIEGKSASAWLKDYAVTKLRRYAAVEDLFAQYNLSLTDEEKTEIEDNLKSLDNDLGMYAQYYGLPGRYLLFR